MTGSSSTDSAASAQEHKHFPRISVLQETDIFPEQTPAMVGA